MLLENDHLAIQLMHDEPVPVPNQKQKQFYVFAKFGEGKHISWSIAIKSDATYSPHACTFIGFFSSASINSAPFFRFSNVFDKFVIENDMVTPRY